MWDTCSINLEVRLPRDIAAAASEMQETDPEFLSRVLVYGLTRRAIFEHLREQKQGSDARAQDPPALV